MDPERNWLIAHDVAREARKGKGACLVLSDRKAHCEAIQSLLWREYDISSELLTGDELKAQRTAIVDRLNGGNVNTLIATGQLVGEGFDCKHLTTLFLATPIRFNGRVLQYLGRVLRPAPDKKMAKVYDYRDIHVGALEASARARERAFKA